MRLIADLHVHSRFSYACRREMEAERLAWWARRKGINLLGTGVFTHPICLTSLKQQLEPVEEGLFRLREGERKVPFLLPVDVTNILRHAGRLPRTHTPLFPPSFATADRLIARFGS